MSSLTVEQLDPLGALPPEIEDAFHQPGQADFQGALDWYRLLARTALAVDEEPRLHVLRRDGRPIAVLPMRRHSTDGYAQLGALANFYTTRFVPFLGDDLSPPELSYLVRSLRKDRPRASRLDFAPMDRASAAYAKLRAALRDAGYLTFEYFCFGNWFMPVTQTADEYLDARPGEVRSTLRRMGKRFAAAGGRIEEYTSGSEVAKAREAFSVVYAASWKRPEPFADFMPALIRLCDDMGWLRMGVAWLGDEPIAAQLWVVANGKASIYKLAYDERHRGYSPGSLLTAALMRHVIDRDRVHEVDYLTGDDRYKRDWMTQRRELWGLTAYDPLQFRGAALALREAAGRVAKSGLRHLRA